MLCLRDECKRSDVMGAPLRTKEDRLLFGALQEAHETFWLVCGRIRIHTHARACKHTRTKYLIALLAHLVPSCFLFLNRFFKAQSTYFTGVTITAEEYFKKTHFFSPQPLSKPTQWEFSGEYWNNYDSGGVTHLCLYIKARCLVCAAGQWSRRSTPTAILPQSLPSATPTHNHLSLSCIFF